jgi:hypothetical protein
MHLEYCRVLFSFHFMIMIKRAFKFETIVKTQDVTAKNLYRFFFILFMFNKHHLYND